MCSLPIPVDDVADAHAAVRANGAAVFAVRLLVSRAERFGDVPGSSAARTWTACCLTSTAMVRGLVFGRLDFGARTAACPSSLARSRSA